MVNPASLDDDDAAEDDEGELEIDGWSGKAGLLALLKFCALQSKSEMVKSVLCDGAFEDSSKHEKCINGACPACGFGKRIWSKLLRPEVVDKDGNLKPDAPVEFSSIVKWRRIRSSKTRLLWSAASPAPRRRLHHCRAAAAASRHAAPPCTAP